MRTHDRLLLIALLAAVLLGACAGAAPSNPGADPASEDLAAPVPGPEPDLSGPAPDKGGPTPDLGKPADLAPPVPLVRFVAMGDTGKGNEGQKQVAAAIATKCAMSGCDFVTLLGDNIYDSGISSPSDPQMQTKFEQPYAMLSMPFYAVLGNHDYGADGAGIEFDKGENEVKYTARSMKWRMPAAYYRFTSQHVEFFGLDTNMQLFNNVAKQKPDMTAWIRASTATWKIALGHHPYLSNGPHGNAGWYDLVPFLGEGVKKFMDDVVCGKVDLYLCGHDHSRQWLETTCKGTELVVSGAGASTTELRGGNKTRFQKDTLGFLYVRIEGRRLTGEFIDSTGKVEFTRTLMK